MTSKQHKDVVAAVVALLCRVETVNGKRTFTFKDQMVGQYIDGGSAAARVGHRAPVTGYHSIVQDLAWPSPQDESPIIVPAQNNQRSGSLWFQEDLLAHTLLHRQMLQPAMKAAQLQVTCSLQTCNPCPWSCSPCACRSGWYVCASNMEFSNAFAQSNSVLRRVSSWSVATLKASLAG